MNTIRSVVRSIFAAVQVALQAPVLVSVLLAATTATANPVVTFLDGGYAELCSAAAHNAESRLDFELTGSRLPHTPVEICTLAIDSGELSATQLAGSHNNRGVLLFVAGDLDAALADFDRALALTDQLPQIHVNRGYTLNAQERWAESIAAFDQGIVAEAPDLAKAHYNRGIAHEELGHVREAYLDYRQAAELEPEWSAPQQELTRFVVGP